MRTGVEFNTGNRCFFREASRCFSAFRFPGFPFLVCRCVYVHVRVCIIHTHIYIGRGYVREAEVDSSGGFAGLRAGKCGSRPGTECRYAGGNDRYGGRARPLSDNLTRIHRRCIGGGEVKRIGHPSISNFFANP